MILGTSMRTDCNIPNLLNFLRDETGQDMIEYALVAALIGLSAVVSMKTLSTKVGNAYTSVGTSLTSDI